MKEGRTLAIGAHPDDVELGCAGSLYKLPQSLIFLVFSECSTRRKQEQLKSAKIFDAEVHFGDLYGNTYRENVREVENLISLEVENVYLHWKEDTHQDHRYVYDIVLSALRRFNGNIFLYETPSSLNFVPNVFVDISDHFEAKLNVFGHHVSQNKTKTYLKKWIQATARYRGCQRHTSYAEGFVAYQLME